MEENKEHLCHLMSFYYQKGKDAAQTAEIYSVCGEDILAGGVGGGGERIC